MNRIQGAVRPALHASRWVEGLRMHQQPDVRLLRRLCTSSQSMRCSSLSLAAPVARRTARCAASMGSCDAGIPEASLCLQYLCMHHVRL